jgi:DNA-directed RNA polymerase specialized sigma24 family protein
MQHLKYEEIADILQKPIGTIKVYLGRGLKILQMSLKGVLKE